MLTLVDARMFDLDSIYIDAFGWGDPERGETEIVWSRPDGDTLGLHLLRGAPELPATLDDLDTIRAHARESLAAVDGCVVEIERVDFQDLAALRQIFKFRSHGNLVYRGSFTLPFHELSFVIQVDCPVVGTTGIRELLVAEKGMAGEGLPAGQNWFADPYDPTFEAPILRAFSDDASFDDLVPDHALSRLRHVLDRLSATTAVDIKLCQLEPFVAKRPTTVVRSKPRPHGDRSAHSA